MKKNITSNHLLFWPSSQSKDTGQQHLFLVISFLCLIFKNEFHIVSHSLSDTKASMYTWEDSASTMHYFIQHETLSGSEEMAQGLRALYYSSRGSEFGSQHTNPASKPGPGGASDLCWPLQAVHSGTHTPLPPLMHRCNLKL